MLTVVYEHLLINPERETKKICTFLGIEWTDLMLSPGDKKHLGEKAITTQSNEIWYDSNTYNRNPDNRNIEKWQSKLTLGQQLKTTMAFMDNKDLIQYGYDFSVDSLTQANKILARGYFFCLYYSRMVFRFLFYVFRKIPGFSLLRNGLAAVARFLR
jgi:hypothetical protein